MATKSKAGKSKARKASGTRKGKAQVKPVATGSETSSTPTDRTYAAVTARIIEALEAGTVPWHKPWIVARSMATGKEYRGINALVLGSADFKSPYWMTYKQAQDLGGNVKRGERGTPVVFWKWWGNDKVAETVEDETADKFVRTEQEKRAFGATPFYYTVFNLDQCENIPADKIPALPNPTHTPKQAAEAILAEYAKRGPAAIHGGAKASYSPREDVVRLPAPENFENSDHYYAAAFHEFAHSTGHPSRLNRFAVDQAIIFGDASYSKEELVAEITSAMLCAVSGIERQQENSAAYIASWLAALRNDKRFLISAAQQAQRAADYMRGIESGAPQGAAKETSEVAK